MAFWPLPFPGVTAAKVAFGIGETPASALHHACLATLAKGMKGAVTDGASCYRQGALWRSRSSRGQCREVPSVVHD
jgi:hypothetical protein